MVFGLFAMPSGLGSSPGIVSMERTPFVEKSKSVYEEDHRDEPDWACPRVVQGSACTSLAYVFGHVAYGKEYRGAVWPLQQAPLDQSSTANVGATDNYLLIAPPQSWQTTDNTSITGNLHVGTSSMPQHNTDNRMHRLY